MNYNHLNQKGVFKDYETYIQERVRLLELKGCTTRTIEDYPWRLQRLDFHQLACGQLNWTRLYLIKKEAPSGAILTEQSEA